MLVETVLSIPLTLDLTREALYTTFALVDDFYPSERIISPRCKSICADKDVWVDIGIVPCGRCTGVAQFLCIIVATVKAWTSGWTSTLDEIGRAVEVDVSPFSSIFQHLISCVDC